MSVKGQFTFNSTLEEKTNQYQQVTSHIQPFRDITPGGGAYFVRFFFNYYRSGSSGLFVVNRMKAMFTNQTMNNHIGVLKTMLVFSPSRRNSEFLPGLTSHFSFQLIYNISDPKNLLTCWQCGKYLSSLEYSFCTNLSDISRLERRKRSVVSVLY